MGIYSQLQTKKTGQEIDSVQNLRQRFVKTIVRFAGIYSGDLEDDTPFYCICYDNLDFIELLTKLEVDAKMEINEGDHNQDSFDNAKDFIDWLIETAA